MKEEVVWGRALTPQGRQREPVSGRIQVGFSLCLLNLTSCGGRTSV